MTSAIPPRTRRTAARCRSARPAALPASPGLPVPEPAGPGPLSPRGAECPVRDVAAPRYRLPRVSLPPGADPPRVPEPVPVPAALPAAQNSTAWASSSRSRGARARHPPPMARGSSVPSRPVPPWHPARPRRSRPRRTASRPRRDGTGPPPTARPAGGLPWPRSPPLLPLASPASPAVPRELPGTPSFLFSLAVPTYPNISIPSFWSPHPAASPRPRPCSHVPLYPYSTPRFQVPQNSVSIP